MSENDDVKKSFDGPSHSIFQLLLLLLLILLLLLLLQQLFSPNVVWLESRDLEGFYFLFFSSLQRVETRFQLGLFYFMLRIQVFLHDFCGCYVANIATIIICFMLLWLDF